jgi:hypothetical protein
LVDRVGLETVFDAVRNIPMLHRGP